MPSVAVKPNCSLSDVTRPYVLSVEGEIPAGSQIRILVRGELPGSAPWAKVYVNPQSEPLVTQHIVGFSFEIHPPPHSIAVPFLYAIVIEGDGQKWSINAEELARVGGNQRDLVLVQPEADSTEGASGSCGRAYLTRRLFPAAWVALSQVRRPWVFEVIGDTPDDSQIVVTLTAQESDGSVLEKQFHGPCREPLASTTLHSVQYTVTLHASSDGSYTPFFHGLAIEGDGRCFYTTVNELMHEDPSEEHTLDIPETQSISGHLSPIPVRQVCRHFEPLPLPESLGYPEAFSQLVQMHARGELAGDDNPITLPEKEGWELPSQDTDETDAGSLPCSEP